MLARKVQRVERTIEIDGEKKNERYLNSDDRVLLGNVLFIQWSTYKKRELKFNKNFYKLIQYFILREKK